MFCESGTICFAVYNYEEDIYVSDSLPDELDLDKL